MLCYNRRWDICLLCMLYAGSLEEKKELERIQCPPKEALPLLFSYEHGVELG